MTETIVHNMTSMYPNWYDRHVHTWVYARVRLCAWKKLYGHGEIAKMYWINVVVRYHSDCYWLVWNLRVKWWKKLYINSVIKQCLAPFSFAHIVTLFRSLSLRSITSSRVTTKSNVLRPLSVPIIQLLVVVLVESYIIGFDPDRLFSTLTIYHNTHYYAFVMQLDIMYKGVWVWCEKRGRFYWFRVWTQNGKRKVRRWGREREREWDRRAKWTERKTATAKLQSLRMYLIVP